jgi:pimeloyl-ACP methyl ester carboxylesterase
MLVAVLTVPAAAASVRVTTVCLSVHNPGDPQASTLFGRRYTPGGATSATPAIVLVHGIASSTANWEFLPGFSVARNLAQAGYVVISYDRLGFAKSRYSRSGNLILTGNHQSMLHELVGEVKNGNYATTGAGDCSGVNASPGPGTQVPHATVAVMGHSAGGAIVQGYAGRFHDVAAVVQADYSNQGHGAIVDSQFATVGAKIAAGDDYPQFFDNRQQCLAFNIHPPGAVPSVVDVACNPGGFVRTPAGEFTGFPALQQTNNTFIPQTGTTPVLLGYADHDAAFPPEAADADERYWRTACAGCDVTRLEQTNSGHLFPAHRVMPSWVNGVVSWLRSKGIRP